MTAMRVVAPLLLLATAEATASPCEVTVPRAPDEVRTAIENWVRAEPRCATPLEVRVVTTEGGFYLFARDPAGRVRERIVPDAQSAGVLVASWVADDAAPERDPAPAPPASAPAVEVDIDARPDATVIEISPPGQVVALAPALPPATIDRLAPVARSEPARAPRWLALGGTLRVEDGGGAGVRGEIDLAARGPWSAGIALAGSRSYTQLYGGWNYGSLTTHDLRATGIVARTSHHGAWDLRFAAGLGLVRTTVDGYVSDDQSTDSYAGEGLSATGEVGIQLSRRFGPHWAIGAGPLATFYQRNLEATRFDDVSFEASGMTVSRRTAEVSLFAGLRRAL